jgi:hypothetical protein
MTREEFKVEDNAGKELASRKQVRFPARTLLPAFDWASLTLC